MDEKKNPLKSKTIWVNGLTLAVTIGSALTGVPIPHLATVLAVANIVLRFLTKGPIGLSDAK